MTEVINFAVAYRKARGEQLLPRTLCSCGCNRTVRAIDRVCMFIPKGETERRVYFDEQCFFADIQRRSSR